MQLCLYLVLALGKLISFSSPVFGAVILCTWESENLSTANSCFRCLSVKKWWILIVNYLTNASKIKMPVDAKHGDWRHQCIWFSLMTALCFSTEWYTIDKNYFSDVWGLRIYLKRWPRAFCSCGILGTVNFSKYIQEKPDFVRELAHGMQKLQPCCIH